MVAQTLSTVFQAGSHASEDVRAFRLERTLGQVVSADIDVYFSENIDPEDLLGSPAYLGFGRESAEHDFDGVVIGVTLVATPVDENGRGAVHRLHVTSLLGLLEQEVDCQIFQGKDVKEIVVEVMTDMGIDAKNQSWRLVGTYGKRDVCVQYCESALAFVSRLLEEEGIYFHSEHGDDGELIVFSDDSTTSDQTDPGPTIKYRYKGAMEQSEDTIGVITQRHRTASGKVTYRDYDFTKPQLDLTVSTSADVDTDLEVYDYPGLYSDPTRGKQLAQVRLEAMQAERTVLEVRAGAPRLVPGRWLELTEAPDPLDGQYFITSAIHELKDAIYVVHATMIPKTVKYRTPRRTPVPIIDGPQTAVIVAPPGSPNEDIHTDELGRCKVKFHWDSYAKNDDTASFWMRTSQLQTGGLMILPRVGWEVIVEFQEGNPDRPMVTGRVWNGRYMPPYALPEGKSRTSLQTASSPGGAGRNEIRMEDKAGSEEISVQSQKDTTVATGNNKTKSTAANESKNVGVNSTLTIGADQSIKVTNGYENTVGGAQTLVVGGSRTVEINAVYSLASGGASSTAVGGSQMEMDGNPLQALLALAVKAATAAAQAEAAQAMSALDQAVASKVDQVMGPINQVQAQAQAVGNAMNAVSNGDMSAAAGAVAAASGMPTPAGFGAAAAGGDPSGGGAAPADRGDPSAGGGAPPSPGASAASGLDSLVHGAIAAGGDALGSALGAGGGGGGGSSEANAAGPDGAASGNASANSTTGPGWAINTCSATHAETVGSIKASIAAAGIHTTVTGARTTNVGAARVELVGGTRAETCAADKTEKAVGLVVLSSSPESETVGGSRKTMVGGAILEKIGGSCTVAATGKAMLVGAFHKIDASGSIVFKCGDSEVVIDGGGVAIKSALVTISAPNVTLTGTTTEA